MVVLFLGPSGSGKDTQAELLQQKLGKSVLISTGDLARVVLDNKTHKHYMEVKRCLDEGKWIPDDIIYELLRDRIATVDAQHIIFTGAIRTAPQIPLLDTVLTSLDMQLDVVFSMELSQEVAMERMLSRGRDDDERANIQSRFNEFNKHNPLIVEEFRERGILYEIDASQTIEAIHSDILHILKTKYAGLF